MPTSGYTAGAIPSQAYIAMGPETAWGTASIDLTATRFTSDSLSDPKTRTRPAEIDQQRSVSSQETNGTSASGATNFIKSFGTFDAPLAALLGGAWASNILTDGDVFSSFTIEKKIAASIFYQYLGMYPTAWNLNIAQGAIVGGAFNWLGKKVQKATTTLDATIAAAPTGRPVTAGAGIPSLLIGGAPLGKLTSFNLSIQNQNAGDQRAIDDLAPIGISPGLLMVSAEGEGYFKDFSAYDRFVAESRDLVALRIQDPAGKGYLIELLAPDVDAPAPGIQAKDRPVMQRIQLAGNPSTAAAGKTIRITRDVP